MARYAGLLGSINIGSNRLSMADLRHALEREEFEDVETVVASGNVLFTHDDRTSEGLAEKIAYVVQDRFDIDSCVIVRSRDELEQVLAENPFAETGDDAQVHVHFSQRQPSSEQIETLIADHASLGSERIAGGVRVLYIDYADGVAGSKVTGDFMARRLGCRGTARNIRSVKRIVKKIT